MTTLCTDCGVELPDDDWIACEACSTIDSADDPDAFLDEAEDKETTDNERDDHEGVPVVDLDGDSDERP